MLTRRVTLNLVVPSSWEELTQRQMRYLHWLLSCGRYSPEQVRTMALIRFAGIKPDGFAGKGFVFHRGDERYTVMPEQIAALLPMMDWVVDLPQVPVRLEEMRGCKAVNARLYGVPFEHYLTMENNYQGYIRTKDSRLLEAMTPYLYGRPLRLSPAEAHSVFVWFASVKRLLAARFPHFFVSAPASGEEDPDIYNTLRKGMNMQIRALTKGDITKEKEILQMDMWRAIGELDAQAEEYEELKKQYHNAK